MPRPLGRKNADHHARRRDLARAVLPIIRTSGANRPSLRELARAAGVQPNTMRHYFGDRDGVITAAFVELRALGDPHIKRTIMLTSRPVDEALRIFLGELVGAWTPEGLAGVLGAGLLEGLSDTAVGPAYVEHLLEPTLQSAEHVIESYMNDGELRAGDPRGATLMLIAPILLALLHQHELGGAGCRPLDVHALLEQHVQAFLRAWAPEPAAGAPGSPAEPA